MVLVQQRFLNYIVSETQSSFLQPKVCHILFLYFTAYIITSYHSLVLFTFENTTFSKIALQELLHLYCSMYSQYKYCHLLWQMESSVFKLQISKKLLFRAYLKEPARKTWTKIQPKSQERTFSVVN